MVYKAGKNAELGLGIKIGGENKQSIYLYLKTEPIKPISEIETTKVDFYILKITY